MSRTGCNYSYKPEEIDDAMESLNFVNGPFVTQVPTNVMVQTTNIQVTRGKKLYDLNHLNPGQLATRGAEQKDDFKKGRYSR